MKKNEFSPLFSSEDYLFGKAPRNFTLPDRSISTGSEEVRRLINVLGLCSTPSEADRGLDRRRRVASVWRFRRDREAYYCAGEKGFRLDGLNHIPRNSPTASFDYQLELPF